MIFILIVLSHDLENLPRLSCNSRKRTKETVEELHRKVGLRCVYFCSFVAAHFLIDHKVRTRISFFIRKIEDRLTIMHKLRAYLGDTHNERY